MPSELLPPTREGLIEALELLPDFVAAIVMHLEADGATDDGWALEHLGELQDAVDSFVAVTVQLMAERRARQARTN